MRDGRSAGALAERGRTSQAALEERATLEARQSPSFEPGDHYRDMVDAFSEAMLKGEPVPLPPEDGLKNLRVLEALARSSAKNSVEAV
jgi:predicted dehydrogenase